MLLLDRISRHRGKSRCADDHQAVGNRLVSAAEAAEMLSIGKSTFWREVKKGTILAAVKIGGLTRWRVADLEACVMGLSSTCICARTGDLDG